MNAELIWIGILRGCYSVPVALAFALVVRHGRYLPLWLPECGMLAAYLAYLLSGRTALPFPAVALAACLAGTGIALLIHHWLFAVYARRPEPLKALLRSIGIVVVLESLVNILSGGYSLAFSASSVDGWGSAGEMARQDRLVLIGSVVLTAAVWLMINRTRSGLVYRAVSSNRSLARRYGLPVGAVDLMVIAIGGVLCSLGGIINGVRYGLTADMMMTNALKVVAVVVAVGEERLGLIALGMLLLGVAESLCQASPRFSAFEHGVPYALLAIALVLRYGFEPLIRRAFTPAPPTSTQEPEALQ